MKPVARARHSGFTLLEALVATVLLGTALALVIGGLGRSSAYLFSTDLHQIARELAEQKLLEFTRSNANTMVNDQNQLVFRGVKYGYRLKYEPVKSTEALPTAGTPLEGKLLAVRIEVYWGEGTPPPHSLDLQTLVMRP